MLNFIEKGVLITIQSSLHFIFEDKLSCFRLLHYFSSLLLLLTVLSFVDVQHQFSEIAKVQFSLPQLSQHVLLVYSLHAPQQLI